MTRRSWRGLAAWSAAALLAACYEPGFAPCTIECAPTGEPCPGGMECGTDGLCVLPGGACVDTSGPVRRTIAAGAEHLCAITEAGNRIVCWGSNARGQLAAAPTTLDSDPIEIIPPVSGPGTWIDLAAGAYHTCALRDLADPAADEIVCWGDNTALQLGDVATGDPLFFRPATPPSSAWRGIGAGEHHSCGIAEDSVGTRVYCWGANDSGQLTGTAGQDSATPAAVATPDVAGAWRMVDGGARHTCAATTEARLVCWGSNSTRQLSGSTDATNPRLVEPPGAYAIVAAGADHTCAITVPGMVQCWGDNTGARLGIASTEPTIDTPAPVLDRGAMARWSALDTSASVSCGIKDGATLCWGPGFPQAGLGTLGSGQATPVGQVLELGTAVDVAASPTTSCAFEGDMIRCWGDSLHGELGDTTRTIESTPVFITPPTGTWDSVQAGATHTCGVTRDAGNLYRTYCWGLSSHGQAGSPTAPLMDATTTPAARDMAGPEPRTVATGARHTCAVYETAPDPQVRCWGDDSLLQNPATSEGAAFTLANAANPEITADGAYTCVTGSTTHLPQCWGTPDGDAGHASATPTTISPNTQLRPESVVWGAESGCGLENLSRAVWCFGTEYVGELGNGALGNPTWPMSTAATAIVPMELMARGAGQSRCAGSDAMGVMCWGDNRTGQVLPTAPGGSFDQPMQTLSAAQVSSALESLAIGRGHGCAIILAGNDAVCWGAFEMGQRTGLATSTALAPVQNPPPPSVSIWRTISAGGEHTCATADGGTLVCWGRNTYGQLGNGASARPIAGPIILP